MTVLQTIILIIEVVAVLVALAMVGLNFANAYVCRLDKLQSEATGCNQTPVGRWLYRHKQIDRLLFFAEEHSVNIIVCCISVAALLSMPLLFLML